MTYNVFGGTLNLAQSISWRHSGVCRRCFFALVSKGWISFMYRQITNCLHASVLFGISIKLLIDYSAAINSLMICQLENVAIANALQLEAARATPALSRFNYTPRQV